MRITELFVRAGLVESAKQAKRLITSGGAKINDTVITDPTLLVKYTDSKLIVGQYIQDTFVIHECSLHRGCSGSRKRPG